VKYEGCISPLPDGVNGRLDQQRMSLNDLYIVDILVLIKADRQNDTSDYVRGFLLRRIYRFDLMDNAE